MYRAIIEGIFAAMLDIDLKHWKADLEAQVDRKDLSPVPQLKY